MGARVRLTHVERHLRRAQRVRPRPGSERVQPGHLRLRRGHHLDGGRPGEVGQGPARRLHAQPADAHPATDVFPHGALDIGGGRRSSATGWRRSSWTTGWATTAACPATPATACTTPSTAWSSWRWRTTRARMSWSSPRCTGASPGTSTPTRAAERRRLSQSYYDRATASPRRVYTVGTRSCRFPDRCRCCTCPSRGPHDGTP